MLFDTKFGVENINGKVGVMAIIGYGGRRYEHATFRRDVYDGQNHAPIDVKFIDDLEEDAKRRDFKINALYYDILTNEITDPFMGLSDLTDFLITTTRNPKIVYEEDPERIVRAIRLSVQLGFKFPQEELDIILNNLDKLQYLSSYRIKREFEKMLKIDKIYENDNPNKVSQMFTAITDFGLWDMFLPGMYDALESNAKNSSGENFIDAITKKIKNVDSDIRLEVIMYELARLEMQNENLKESNFEGVLDKTLDYNLGEETLGFTKEEIKNVKLVVNDATFTVGMMVNNAKIRGFVFDHRFVFDKLIKMMKYIPCDEKREKVRQKTLDLITKEFDTIKSEKYPFDSEKLDIGSEELIRSFPKIKLDKLPEFREAILKRMVVMKKSNIKEDLIFVGTKELEENGEYFLDK